MLANELTDTLTSPAMTWALVGIGVLLLMTLVREIPRIPPKLLVLMAAAFLDMVGLLMIVPLLPFYVKRLSGAGVDLAGLHLGPASLVGAVAAAFTLAQLLSAPLWGRFSDRRGRRPTLLIALGASAVAYLVFGFAESLPLLLLSRLVQGVGGGTVGVIQAYVADTTEPEQRARALGWLSASTNLGVALGPVLGSVAVSLGDVDVWPGAADITMGHAAPGIFAALLCVVTMLFAARYLRESNTERHTHAGKVRVPLAQAIHRIVRHPIEAPSRLILTYAIAIGAFMGVTAVLALFLEHRFGIDENTIGYVFLWIGAISVFTRVLALGPLVDRFGEALLSRVGILILTTGMLALPWVNSLTTLAIAIALLPLGTAFTFPCVTALLSRVITSQDRGMYMGLQQTFGGVMRIASPLLCGFVFDRVGATAPFYVSAALVLVTLPLGFGLGAAARRAAVN